MCGRTACCFADSPSVNILCKSLDKSKKCAIIKVRGNTGDGYFLPSVKNNRQALEVCGRLFLFVLNVDYQLYHCKYESTQQKKLFQSYVHRASHPSGEPGGRKRKIYILRFGRKQPPPAGSACTRQSLLCANAFCLASVATKRYALCCLVFPRSRISPWLFYYTPSAAVCQACFQKPPAESDSALRRGAVYTVLSAVRQSPIPSA